MISRETKTIIKYAAIYAAVVSFFLGISLLELAFIPQTPVVVPMVLINLGLMIAIGVYLYFSRWSEN